MAGETSRPNAFALKNSGFEAFLYADVGTELNGSPLTILSVLARLGGNPWEQAAIWAALPRDAATRELSHSIAQMPLGPATLAGSRDIAARLVQLLPATARPGPLAKGGGALPLRPAWPPMMLIGCGIVVWMVLSMALGFKPPAGGVASAASPSALSDPAAAAAVVPLDHAAPMAPTVPIAR